MGLFSKEDIMRLLFAAMAVSFSICHPACAEGIIQQLPEDASWALFRIEGVKDASKQGGPVRHFAGQLKVSSVGTVTVDGEKCRWMEIEHTYRGQNEPIAEERGRIYKVLIGEKQLVPGGTPIDRVRRAWVAGFGKFASQPREIRSNNGATIPKAEFEPEAQFFLAGPAADARPLEPELIESKLGKRTCAGLTGRIDTSTLPKSDNKQVPAATFEIRLHKEAPFGVVSYAVKLAETDGRRVEFKAILEDFGTTATSRLPDSR